MIDDLQSIAEGIAAVVAGLFGAYVAALLVYFLLMYLVTREGTGVLMTRGGLSRAFYLQLGLCWMLAGVAAGAVALLSFPEMPMAGAVVASVAGMLALVLVRLRNKVRHQQTLGDTVLLLLCLLVGFCVPLYLHLI